MRLEDSSNGGVIVHHNSESSLVMEVKSKQHVDEQLMKLKELAIGKLNESLSLGEWLFKVRRVIFCYRCRWVEGPDPRRSPWVPLLNSSGFDKNVQ